MKKIKVKTSKSEKDLIVKSLVKMRNKLIRENKSAEPVNELLIKLIENKYINEEASREISFFCCKNMKGVKKWKVMKQLNI